MYDAEWIQFCVVSSTDIALINYNAHYNSNIIMS